jgi:acyl-coenzyme A thioesterase PaaI-like protein
MTTIPMSPAVVQQVIARQFPGLLGIELAETTTESRTKFMAAAPAGQVLTGESVPLHRGRTTMVWQTSMRREDGRFCALVLQTRLVMEPKAVPAA